MSHRILLCTMLFIAAALTHGCASSNAVVIANEAMNGQRGTLQQGAELSVELPENPSTGYRWQIDDEPGAKILTPTGSTFVRSDNSSGAVGVGGTRRFAYRAMSVGSCSLHYTLIPPGRGRADGEQHYSIDVDVTD